MDVKPAMLYVQKIRQRCDPDTYRQFLDILGTTSDSADKVRPPFFVSVPFSCLILRSGGSFETDCEIVQGRA